MLQTASGSASGAWFQCIRAAVAATLVDIWKVTLADMRFRSAHAKCDIPSQSCAITTPRLGPRTPPSASKRGCRRPTQRAAPCHRHAGRTDLQCPISVQVTRRPSWLSLPRIASAARHFGRPSPNRNVGTAWRLLGRQHVTLRVTSELRGIRIIGTSSRRNVHDRDKMNVQFADLSA